MSFWGTGGSCGDWRLLDDVFKVSLFMWNLPVYVQEQSNEGMKLVTSRVLYEQHKTGTSVTLNFFHSTASISTNIYLGRKPCLCMPCDIPGNQPQHLIKGSMAQSDHIGPTHRNTSLPFFLHLWWYSKTLTNKTRMLYISLYMHI